MSTRALADALDLGTTTVSRMLSGEQPWHLGDVLALPATVAGDVLRAMLDEVERPTTRVLDVQTSTMMVGAASGDLQRAVVDAMADGELSPSERRDIGRAALTAINAALSVVRGVR